LLTVKFFLKQLLDGMLIEPVIQYSVLEGNK